LGNTVARRRAGTAAAAVAAELSRVSAPSDHGRVSGSRLAAVRVASVGSAATLSVAASSVFLARIVVCCSSLLALDESNYPKERFFVSM